MDTLILAVDLGPLGKIIAAVFAVIGTIILIFAVLRAIGNFASGKIGPAFKIIGGGVIAAIICFNILTLPVALANAAGGIVTATVDVFTNTVEKNGGVVDPSVQDPIPNPVQAPAAD